MTEYLKLYKRISNVHISSLDNRSCSRPSPLYCTRFFHTNGHLKLCNLAANRRFPFPWLTLFVVRKLTSCWSLWELVFNFCLPLSLIFTFIHPCPPCLSCVLQLCPLTCIPSPLPTFIWLNSHPKDWEFCLPSLSSLPYATSIQLDNPTEILYLNFHNSYRYMQTPLIMRNHKHVE